METDEHLALSVLLVWGFFFWRMLFKFESEETEVYMDYFGYEYGLEVLKQQCHIYKLYGDAGTRADFSSTFSSPL